jgi:hypothetical protein
MRRGEFNHTAPDVLLGNLFPSAFAAVAGLEYAHVNLVVALCSVVPGMASGGVLFPPLKMSQNSIEGLPRFTG